MMRSLFRNKISCFWGRSFSMLRLRLFAPRWSPAGRHRRYYSAPAAPKDASPRGELTNWQILRQLWPRIFSRAADGRNLRRIGVALGMMVAGKALNVQVPLLFKQLVDRLDQAMPLVAQQHMDAGMVTVAGGLLLGYASARIGANLLAELKNVVFARVSQGCSRPS